MSFHPSSSKLADDFENVETDDGVRDPVQGTGSLITTGKKGRKKGWKPVSMHPAILLSMAIICLGFVIILQVLFTTSMANNGLAFAPVQGTFSSTASFLFQYLPTIISVSLNIFWSWVDLDHKRMEPFLQMSKRDGASAEDSMLLHYPFQFIVTAPIKAVRRGHWAVALSGTVMLLFTLAITPLQGAIFVTDLTNRTVNIQANQSTSFAALAQRAPSLDGSFLDDMWSIIWFNQTLPAFTRMNETVMPLDAGSAEQFNLEQSTVEANRTLFHSSLNCTKASKPDNHFWDAGTGCKVVYDLQATFKQNGEDTYYLNYFGWGTNKSSTPSLFGENAQGPNCVDQFFGYWFDNLTDSTLKEKEGGFFCTPNYWAEDALVTLAYPNYSIVSVNLSGKPQRLDANVLNATKFQSIISTGWDDSGASDGFDTLGTANPTLNAPDQLALSEDPRLVTANQSFNQILPSFVTPMVGISIGLTLGRNYTSLMNYHNFTAAMSRVNSFAFAIATGQLLNDSLGVPTDVDAQVTGLTRSYVVSEVQTRIVQALFALICAMCLALVVLDVRRTCNLTSDPNSLAAIASLAPSDENLRDSVPDGKPQLSRYYLHSSPGGAYVRRINLPHDIFDTASKKERDSKDSRTWVPWRPFYLGEMIGAFFIASIFILFVVIIVLQVFATRNNGISPPSVPKFWQGIILSYLPTIFATLIEPFWVLLSHTLCLLQPFEEFRKVNAPSKKSARARYLSVPPQLIFFRALSNGHLLLALICIISLSSNLLAVGLASLFEQRLAALNVTVPASQSLGASFSQESPLSGVEGVSQTDSYYSSLPGLYQDHFYVAQMNLSGRGTLPPWTTPKGYFVPVDYDTPEDSNSRTTYIHTQGFTYEPICNSLNHPDFGTDFAINVTLGSGIMYGLAPNVSLNLPSVPGLPDCTAGPWGWLVDVVRKPEDNGTTGLNAVIQLDPADNRTCPSMFLGIFIRDPDLPPVREDGPNFSYNGFQETSGSYFYCGFGLTTAEYDVQLNEHGHIISVSNTTMPASLDPQKYFHGNSSALMELLDVTATLEMLATTDIVFSNATASNQWFTYLMSLMDDNQDIIDPTKPAPAVEHVMDLASRTISLLGAILLSQNRDTIFDKQPSPNPLTVQQIVLVPRVFLNPVMLPLTLVLLAVHALVAIAFFVLAPKKLLPVLPTTLGRQLGLFAGSSLLHRPSTQGSGRSGLPEKSGPLWDDDVRLGYGRFRGTDGVLRTGIERAQFVTPIPNLKARKIRGEIAGDEPKQESYGEERVPTDTSSVTSLTKIRRILNPSYRKLSSD